MITTLFHVDIDLRWLMDAGNIAIGNAAQVRWYLTDQFVLALRFKRRADGVWTAFDLSGIASYRAMLKATRAAGAPELATTTNDQFNRLAYWADTDPATGCICCKVDLNSPEIIAHFATSASSKELWFEIEGMDAEGNTSTLVQFAVTVMPAVITGTEGSPASAGVHYMTLEEVLALCMPRILDGGNYRLRNGKLQMWNRATQLWHEWGITTENGASTIWIGEGEA